MTIHTTHAVCWDVLSLPHFDERMPSRSFPPRPEMSRVFSGVSKLQPRKKTKRYWPRGFPNTQSGKVNADRLHCSDESFPSVLWFLTVIHNKQAGGLPDMRRGVNMKHRDQKNKQRKYNREGTRMRGNVKTSFTNVLKRDKMVHERNEKKML